MPTVTADSDLHVVSLAQRPDLESALIEMESSWPDYVRPDPVLVHWVFERYADHQLMVLDDGAVIARAATVPFSWDGSPASLPDTGWDEALRLGLGDTYTHRPLTTLCALEIAVAPGRHGQDLSRRTLLALLGHARNAGFRDVVGPVRPSRKAAEPWTPIDDYLARQRPDGLPEDPWLRVHVRVGGQVLKVCPVSMTISGSLRQWRDWTGLPFDTTGPVEVPGALTPVVVDTARDHAVYVEPNVWVRHRLTDR